jgi:hypothetical protein
MKKINFDIVCEHAAYIAREEARKTASETASAEVGKLAEDAAQIAVRSLAWENAQKAKATRRATFIGAGVALGLVIVAGAAWAVFVKPAGAERKSSKNKTPTALCWDGTVSYARTTRGACSSHGGIKVSYQ